MIDHTNKNSAFHLELYRSDRGVALAFPLENIHVSGDAGTDCTEAFAALAAEYFPPRANGGRDAEWTTEPVWLKHPEATVARRIDSYAKSHPAFAAAWRGDLGDFEQLSPGKGGASESDFCLFTGLLVAHDGDCEAVLAYVQNPESAVTLHGKRRDEERWLRLSITNAFPRAAEQHAREPHVVFANPPALPPGASRVPIPSATPVPKRTREAAPAPTDADPRDVIQLNGGEFNKYAEQCEELLADVIYVRGGSLVRIGHAAEISNAALHDAVGTRREASQAVCIPASAAWLRRALMERAQFWKFDKRAREWDRRDCPKEIAESIGHQEAWSSFRPLVSISPVPVLRADMSLWTAPGYDAQTGVYHSPTLSMPHIPAAPTREDALQALSRLLAPFDQFPYATPEAQAVFLAHVLTAVLRPSFDTSPVFCYTAPAVATGKTLLASMPDLISTGSVPANSPYAEGDELRKVLFASLLAGDSALTLDNIPNGAKVRAPGLCVFATSAMYSDRILGVSETRKVPNRCTVILTGNNITPVGDMARRSLVVRLDANAESARGRTFRIADLKSHVRQHRAQLIVDALTVVRAYAFAGWPKVAHPLESFENWSRLARDPLVWLGAGDPVGSQATETDEEVAPQRAVFAVLAAVTESAGRRFKASQLAILATGNPQLREALSEAGCSEPADAKKVGYWLRENRDKVGAGWKLRQDASASGVVVWNLVAVE